MTERPLSSSAGTSTPAAGAGAASRVSASWPIWWMALTRSSWPTAYFAVPRVSQSVAR